MQILFIFKKNNYKNKQKFTIGVKDDKAVILHIFLCRHLTKKITEK